MLTELRIDNLKLSCIKLGVNQGHLIMYALSNRNI